MSGSALTALLPLMIIAAAAVVVLLGIAVRRSHLFSALVSLAALAAAAVAAALPGGAEVAGGAPLFVRDGLAAVFVGLLSLASAAVCLMSHGYLSRARVRREEYYLLLLLATLGACSLAMSVHAASLFLGLELLSVSLYALIAYLPERQRSAEAGIKYLVLAAASSAFLLFGLALIYARTGSLELSRLAAWLSTAHTDRVLLAGLGMLIVGIGFKLAVVPFHLWASDVYQGAPAPVTALVASVSKAAVVALLLRLFVQLGLSGQPWWTLVFALLAAASMIAGNLLALMQDNLKRLLAYSSIAHLGYLLVAALAGGAEATRAVGFYLVAYMVTTLGAFGVIAALSSDGVEPEELEHYRGLGQRRPLLSGVLCAMLLSLAGIPLTAGFIGKYLVLRAGVGEELWALVFLLVVNSTVGLYAYLRVIVALYMRPRGMEVDHPADKAAGVSLLAGLTLAALTLALVWLGVYPSSALALIRTATAGWF